MTVPPRPGVTPRAPEPLKHVIAEYKHQAQTITCVCGWHGSSASPDGRSSEWSAPLSATERAALTDLRTNDEARPAREPGFFMSCGVRWMAGGAASALSAFVNWSWNSIVPCSRC